MRDVIIWCWGAFTSFSLFTLYEKTFMEFNIDVAVVLAILGCVSAIVSTIFLILKVVQHWNCE